MENIESYGGFDCNFEGSSIGSNKREGCVDDW